ncbi:MAG: MarR family transcriptional regulator [Planctomycetes bacterium]|nr:MarR family transcriptional regulator [Planctomycetota bacterium]
MDYRANVPERTELHDDVANTIQWAASKLQTELAKIAKEAGLSLPQYSVLRILNQADDALSCSEIAARMIARDPDITRLIDKLEKSGMVARERCGKDRRVIRSVITEQGAELAKRVNHGVSKLHRAVFAPLEDQHLHTVRDRLRNLRLK